MSINTVTIIIKNDGSDDFKKSFDKNDLKPFLNSDTPNVIYGYPFDYAIKDLVHYDMIRWDSSDQTFVFSRGGAERPTEI